MENQAIYEAMAAAMAYEMLSLHEHNNDARMYTPALAKCLKRMIDDRDYRSDTLDAHQEIFIRRNGELFDAVQELFGETKEWQEIMSLAASHTGVTPPSSKG